KSRRPTQFIHAEGNIMADVKDSGASLLWLRRSLRANHVSLWLSSQLGRACGLLRADCKYCVQL
ncbi:MAG: hypothetical protein E6357_24465, partial [Clostridiales bacterium]|nr:hypothetical protein [Clostridiales bacterium]